MGQWLDVANPLLALALLGIGLACILVRRRVIKQVIGLSIMLQGVLLILIDAGRVVGDLDATQSIAVSALVVEAIVLAIVLSLVVNVYLHYPSGHVDDLDRLKG